LFRFFNIIVSCSNIQSFAIGLLLSIAMALAVYYELYVFVTFVAFYILCADKIQVTMVMGKINTNE
jgi:peroxiredoxin family protein